MPYITQKERDRINPKLQAAFDELNTKGEIVYAITRLIHWWVEYFTPAGKEAGYKEKSEGKSILQDAFDEYKRMVMHRHENKKHRENGAISGLDARTLEEVR